MYYVSKRMEIAGAHRLDLPYASGCTNLHGHNWIVTVHCKAKRLNDQGMIVDFKHIKDLVHKRLDHKFINDIVDFNPTAENMAKWICDEINDVVGEVCYKVSVQESEGNIATYEKEGCYEDC